MRGGVHRGEAPAEGTLLPREGLPGCAGTSASQDSACTELGLNTSEEWTLLAFGGGPLDAQRVPTELGLTRLQNRHLQAVLVPSEPRYLPETSWGP